MSIFLSLSRFFGLSAYDWDFGLRLDLSPKPATEPQSLAPREAVPQQALREAAPPAAGSNQPQRRELYGMAAAIHSLYQDGVGIDANERR